MGATNIMEFKADLAAFAKKIDAEKNVVVAKVSLDLWTEITTRTPVLTGRARANWFLTQGAPSTRVDLYPGAKPGEIAAPTPPDVSQITGDQPVFIVNNLPYIQALEDGHSRKAPAGMVAVSIQDQEAAIEAGLNTEEPNTYFQNAGQFEAPTP
jgi:hypothetical protein